MGLSEHRPLALLFDLDGTLIDSAPDLAQAANDLRARHGLPALPFDLLRPMVGTGARGMLGVAFGMAPGQPEFEPLRDAFLDLYAQCLLQQTRVFADVLPVLAALDQAGLPWGIVTNKAMRFAQPIVQGLGLASRAAVLVAGDSTAHAKPHPLPLLEAARRMGFSPSRCAYIGDDHRDMVAGRAAGMGTLAAAWGYLGDGAVVADWGADLVLDAPQALLNWLDLA